MSQSIATKVNGQSERNKGQNESQVDLQQCDMRSFN